MTGPDNQYFVQPWIHSDKTRKKNTVVLITLFLKNNTMKHIGNAIKKRFFFCKIVKSAGSRIAILADKIICNHHLHKSARRLHWPCDCPERRSSTFRTTRNTQGQHPKSRWRVVDKYSSSSRSSLNSRMTFRASGNSVLLGKAEVECETIRNTPRK